MIQKLVPVQVRPIVRAVILAEAKREGLSPEDYLKLVIENRVLPGSGYRSLTAYLKDDIDKNERKADLKKWGKFTKQNKKKYNEKNNHHSQDSKRRASKRQKLSRRI